MIYDHFKKYWIKNGEAYLLHWCSQSSNKDYNTPADFNKLKSLICGKNIISQQKFIESEAVNRINCLNGVVDLNTGNLEPHSPEHYFTGIMNFEYEPESECPNWIEFLESALKPNEVKCCQEWFGYNLIKGQRFKKAMIVFGVPDSGKTVFINTLSTLLGVEYVSASSLLQFADPNSHATDSLFGKKANVNADLGQQLIDDVENVKKIIGRDYIRANPKYLKPFEFYADAKLTFATNRFPPLSDAVSTDSAWWNRLIIIEFPRKITHIDRDFEEKYLKPEISGIFNWSLEGLRRLLAQNGFTYDDSQTYTKWNDGFKGQNLLSDFIDTYFVITRNPDDKLPMSVVHQMYYGLFAGINSPLTLTQFGINMKILGFDVGWVKNGGDSHRAYVGIALKQIPPSPQEVIKLVEKLREKTFNIN